MHPRALLIATARWRAATAGHPHDVGMAPLLPAHVTRERTLHAFELAANATSFCTSGRDRLPQLIQQSVPGCVFVAGEVMNSGFRQRLRLWPC